MVFLIVKQMLKCSDSPTHQWCIMSYFWGTFVFY